MSSEAASSALKSKKSTNTLGNPVKLSSKILAAAADPLETGKIWVSLAVGEIRSVVLETGSISPPLRPRTSNLAPLTSLAISTSGSKLTLFAGSWDKNIYSFTLGSSNEHKVLKGHTDFIKSLLPLPSTDLLVSASADSSIIVWNTADGTSLVKLAGHTRGVQALALGEYEPDSKSWTLFSGDSTGEIRAWNIPSSEPSKAAEISLPLGKKQEESTVISPLRIHETSIFDLFPTDEEEVWTASADKTAKSFNPSTGSTETALQHPDFVKSVVVFPKLGLVATGCRDSNIRIWSTTGELKYTLKGHFDEITDLVALDNQLVSTSIDGTLRRWKLGELDNLVKEGDSLEKRGWVVEEKTPAKGLQLTEEEERELAELMDDDDD